MEHHPAQLAVDVDQPLHAQPFQQHVTVFGQHHPLQVRVDLALFFLGACTDGQQRQVMVAQHHHALLAQRMDQAQGFQRLPATVDQVTAEPQFVRRGVELDFFQQTAGDVVTALQVADCPDAHRWASLNAGFLEWTGQTARSLQ